MSKSVRAMVAALFAVGAVASCIGNPASVKHPDRASPVMSIDPGIVVPREYYGRTEFDISGGDGQVVDYSNG